MKQWVQYFEDKRRSKLLNVISLEFSHTRLENYVEQPKFVRGPNRFYVPSIYVAF